MIYLGLLIFGVSMIYIIYLFIDTLIHGVDVPGYFTMIAAVLFIGGINSFQLVWLVNI